MEALLCMYVCLYMGLHSGPIVYMGVVFYK